jgi:hypothetical protein
MSYTLLPNSAVVDIIEMIKATFGALSPLVLLILGLFIGFEVLMIIKHLIQLVYMLATGKRSIMVEGTGLGEHIVSDYEEEDEEDDDEI